MAKIKTLKVGGLQTNCYILLADSSDECVLIDPGGDPEIIIEAVKSEKRELTYILCTHGHADHTGGVHDVRKELGGKFYLDSQDLEYSANPPEWLIGAIRGFTKPPPPDFSNINLENLDFDDGLIEFIRTPGHTPGSTCFLYEDILFTGDTLFLGSIGRYDLPGGDGDLELKNIRDKLFVLDESIKVFPGHGPNTTIGREKTHNPFFKTRT